MSMDGFQHLEDEYHALTTSLSRKISSLQQGVDGDMRAQTISEAEADMYDVQGVLRKMEVEVRHYPFNLKSQAQQQLKLLKTSFESQKKDFDKLKRGGALSKQAAARNSRQASAMNAQQRQHLLEAREYTDQADVSLDNTLRTLDNTIGTGQATTGRLNSQREQLLRSKQALKETDDVLFRARATLKRMARRAMTNKLITGVLILLELIAVALIIYFKFVKKSSSSDGKK